MNKQQISRALKGGVEVAVYATGFDGRIPAGPLGYGSDRARVIRCRVVAIGQQHVERFRGPVGDPRAYRLSTKADGIRVTPLDPLPTGPFYGSSGLALGTRVADPEFDGTEAHAFDGTEDRVVTSRHIVSTWAQWATRLAAYEQAETDTRAAREAREAETKAGLDASAAVAAKLGALGFPVSVEIDRPGQIVVSVKVAEQMIIDINAARSEGY